MGGKLLISATFATASAKATAVREGFGGQRVQGFRGTGVQRRNGVSHLRKSFGGQRVQRYRGTMVQIHEHRLHCSPKNGNFSLNGLYADNIPTSPGKP